MSANSEHDQPVVIQPHSRKVSIVTDPSDNRYDNFGYEPGIRRKASQVIILEYHLRYLDC